MIIRIDGSLTSCNVDASCWWERSGHCGVMPTQSYVDP